MIVFKRPMRLALAKPRANNTSYIQATIFVFQNPMLCRPDKIIQTIQTQVKINMAKTSYVEDEVFILSWKKILYS